MKGGELMYRNQAAHDFIEFVKSAYSGMVRVEVKPISVEIPIHEYMSRAGIGPGALHYKGCEIQVELAQKYHKYIMIFSDKPTISKEVKYKNPFTSDTWSIKRFQHEELQWFDGQGFEIHWVQAQQSGQHISDWWGDVDD
jgi:hypothetical protein